MKKVISKSFLADADIEKIIGLQLRYGVVIASLIVLMGGILYLVQQGQGAIPPYHTFLGESAGYTSFSQIVNGIGAGQAKGIVQAGVVVLIATPILRIAFSLVGFILEKDRLYIIITAIVLSVMLFSIFGGLKI
jgi:uncharacterized membrane protein